MSNYPLRLPDHVMAEAKHQAALSGTSLNQFLSSLIAERVGELRAAADIRARAERANPAAALAILARAPERGSQVPRQGWRVPPGRGCQRQPSIPLPAPRSATIETG